MDASFVRATHRLLSLANAFRRPIRGREHVLAIGTILAAVLAFTASFLIQPEYRSRIEFFVDRASSRGSLPTGLAGLGSSLGITLEDQATQPLAFYAWLTTSDPVLRRLLLDTVPASLRYRRHRDALAASVWAQLLGDPNPADSVAFAKAVSRFRDYVRANVDNSTSLVTVSIGGPTPYLANWLARRLFEHVDSANTVTRQTRAAKEVIFLRSRKSAAAEDLERTEDALRSFYQKNRSFQQDPALVFEEARLRREVDQASEGYLSVNRSARDAEIRAVRDVPALTLIEGPVTASRKSRPKRLVIGLAGLLLGGVAIYGLMWYRTSLASAA